MLKTNLFYEEVVVHVGWCDKCWEGKVADCFSAINM